MQRTLLAIALAGFALPAFAQTAPSSSGIPDNVHSPMAIQSHPGTSAHATAVAGLQDAARIEACGQVAHGFLDALAKGDFPSAAANFDRKMHKAGLTFTKLGEIWHALGARFGKLESRGGSQTVMYRGMPVVSTPLHFEKGDFVSQLACDQQGKIAGFYIRPLQPATAAPASTAQ